MKAGKHNIHFHSISAHFPSVLYPVSVLFLILFEIFRLESFRSTYFHVLLLALISTPVSLLTGIMEWKQKYKGVRVRIFVRKYTYGLALMGIGSIAAAWYCVSPGIISEPGVVHFVFLLLNLSSLPVVTYLGYLGGKLIFEGPH